MQDVVHRTDTLFSNCPMSGISSNDLHESYHHSTPIERLAMSDRVTRAISEKGVATIGDMLMTPGDELLSHKGFGNGTLGKIQRTTEEFLQHSAEGIGQTELDIQSSGTFLASLIQPIIKDERERHILLERMGWQSAPRILQELADQLGLTRERIRQIEKAGLKKLFHWRAAQALEPLHKLMAGMLRDMTPVMSITGICKSIQLHYGWQTPLHKKAISRFLPAFSDLKCLDDRYVCLHGFRCVDCPSLPNALNAVLDGTQEKVIGLAPLARQLQSQMQTFEDCQRCGECPTKPSVSLLRLAFGRSLTAPKRFRVVKNELWARDHWATAKGPLYAALESILKDHVGPMTYGEVHAVVNRTRLDKVTPEMVWHTLSTSVHNGTDILLWDRGGIYQHKCHVNLYTPVLNTVEKWVIDALREGPVPQVSANAAFQVFKDECVAAGLTSEYAVHSCLKHRRHPKLVFHKTPYISLAGGAKYRIPNLEILEEVIRQEGDVVETETLRHIACDRMGLKDYQLTQITIQWENVIRTEKGFLHVDYFNASSPAFISLVEYVKQRLSREGQVSADRIFTEKRVSCLSLRIDDARMLHSVLVRFASASISHCSYPLLTLVSTSDLTTKDTIRDSIVAYVRAKQQPVSCGELRQRFVDKLGFSYQSVMAACLTDGILHYLNGIVVHVDTIAWKDEKQSQLIRVAEQYYSEQARAGEVFARADVLLELHESELPHLAHGIDWTPILIAELLEKDKRVGVFGNRRIAFVFRSDEHPLASFADFVAIVLERHFHGAASLNALSEFLRESRVIAKSVTQKMLEGAECLQIDDWEVAIRGGH